MLSSQFLSDRPQADHSTKGVWTQGGSSHGGLSIAPHTAYADGSLESLLERCKLVVLELLVGRTSSFNPTPLLGEIACLLPMDQLCLQQAQHDWLQGTSLPMLVELLSGSNQQGSHWSLAQSLLEDPSFLSS